MSTQEHAHTGANPQMTRQSFITAEVAKAGSIEALEGKYGIGESIMESWIDEQAWTDLTEYRSERFQEGVVPAEREDMNRNAKLIEQGLERLDKAYKEAAA